MTSSSRGNAPLQIEFEPRAGDFIELLRDLGHLDDAALERLSGALVSQPRGRVVTFDEVRRALAAALFDAEAAETRADTREVLAAEWGRLFY
jgi:hypothetical protein